MAGIRRTWDKEAYKAKALELLERGDDYVDPDEEEKTKLRKNKEEFKPAAEGASGPAGSSRAFLTSRSDKIDLDSKVGIVEVVKQTSTNSSAGPGWFCEVCQCLLKDSASYLDHINGKKHQRALGFSMRVERANVDKVKEKIESLKRKPASDVPSISAIDKYDSKLENAAAEEEKRKKAKKERDQALKVEQQAHELETVDPELAALMGFGGFK